MNNYIKEISEHLQQHPEYSETEIIMYIYLSLGKRLKFDTDFLYGGKMKTREIYYNSERIKDLEKCFISNKIICKSSSNMLTHILKQFGIKCETKEVMSNLTEYEHVVNVIHPKDGSSAYTIDLQKDLMNIHFNSFTTYFGKDEDDPEKFIVSQSEIRRIQTKFGYVSDKKPYFDEYIDFLKLNVPDTLPLEERIDIILNNIEPYMMSNVAYLERYWKHADILDRLLDDANYNVKLFPVDFYSFNGEEKVFNNGYYFDDNNDIKIYYYNASNFKYDCYDLKSFARKAVEEEIYNLQVIPGLNDEREILYDQIDKSYK